jgi:hypothetical protein
MCVCVFVLICQYIALYASPVEINNVDVAHITELINKGLFFFISTYDVMPSNTTSLPPISTTIITPYTINIMVIFVILDPLYSMTDDDKKLLWDHRDYYKSNPKVGVCCF